MSSIVAGWMAWIIWWGILGITVVERVRVRLLRNSGWRQADVEEIAGLAKGRYLILGLLLGIAAAWLWRHFDLGLVP